MYHTYKLENGLIVLEVPNPTSQAVIVTAYVLVGARNEEDQLGGISHFLEHVNFKGTKKYKTAQKLSEVVDAVGGEMNAMTSYEYTQYYVRAAEKQLPLAFDIVSQVFLHPTYPKAEVEREKNVILEEINMYKDNPAKHVADLFQQGMWANHSFGRSILGKPENIKAITRKELMNYRKKYYAPHNSIVAVAGKFKEDDVRKLVKKHWGKYKNGVAIEKPEPAATAEQKRIISEKQNTNQAHFVLGFRAFSQSDDRVPALEVLSSVLSGGMSSRLWSEVREKRGLGYYVMGGDRCYSDDGMFIVRAGVDTKNIKTALQVIIKELGKIKKTPISSSELKKGKEHRKGQLALASEDSHFQLDWYMDQMAFAKKVYSLKEWFRRIDKVTPQEIRKMAQEILDPRRSTFAVIGPYGKSSEKDFEKIIAKL